MSLRMARSLVFFTSAAVLVLEILAGRLMAPYVGVTLETFTGIIGTILAGIALGSWLGGQMADRRPPGPLLGPIMLVGGVLALLSPAIVDLVGPGLSGGDPIQIVVLAGLGFVAPAVVLSAVSPVVVKIMLTSLEETGAVVGSFSAVGTAGAIFGTFFTGFILLATIPTRLIVLVVGGALVVAGVLFTMKRSALTQGVTVGLVALAVFSGGATAIGGGPCDIETTYYCARVTEDPIRPDGRVLWLDTLRHSFVDLEDPSYLHFRYSQIVSDVIETQVAAGPLDALYVGGGGFTLPRWLSAVRPGSTNVVLELDESLLDLSVTDLGLDPDEIDRIAIGDARLTLATTPLDSFDLVVGDAFGGPSVPWHLTTEEFMSSVHDRLRSDGLYVMNLIDYGDQDYARSQAATLAAVFEHVMVIAPPDYFTGDRGGNFVMAASDQPFDPATVAAALVVREAESVPIVGAEVDTWIGNAIVLRDDFAPVDQLIGRP